jgi:hypothetical protein
LPNPLGNRTSQSGVAPKPRFLHRGLSLQTGSVWAVSHLAPKVLKTFLAEFIPLRNKFILPLLLFLPLGLGKISLLLSPHGKFVSQRIFSPPIQLANVTPHKFPGGLRHIKTNLRLDLGCSGLLRFLK